MLVILISTIIHDNNYLKFYKYNFLIIKLSLTLICLLSFIRIPKIPIKPTKDLKERSCNFSQFQIARHEISFQQTSLYVTCFIQKGQIATDKKLYLRSILCPVNFYSATRRSTRMPIARLLVFSAWREEFIIPFLSGLDRGVKVNGFQYPTYRAIQHSTA